LVLRDDPRLEAAVAIARRFQIQLAELAFQFLPAAAISRIAAVVARRVVLLVADVLCQFGVERTLQQRLRQLLEKAVLACDLFGILITLQQRVDQLWVDRVDGHRFS
jgi:hypothetical protein